MQGVFYPPDQICFAPALEDEDMKLREDDKKWIADEISAQVKDAVGNAIDEFNPHGARRVARFVREWGLAGTIIMAFLALLAFGAAAVYQATARVEKQTEFQTKAAKRLDDIEKTLKDIQGDLAKQSIINHAALPLSDFKATLPDLSVAIAAVQKQNVTVSPTVINDLRQKLTSIDTASVGYWPTVLQFLQFATSGLAPANVPPPGAQPVFRTSSGNLYDHNVFSGATVILDGGMISNNRFENCRIIFTEKPVQMTNITFVDSVFEFPVSSVPSPYIQKAGKLILASDLKTTSIQNL